MNAVLNRLLLWQKFALLGLFSMLLILAPLALFVREANKGIDTAQLEEQGIPPVRAVIKVVLLMQQHRGMSALVLSGDNNTEAQRAAKQAEVEKAIEAASAIERQVNNPRLQKHWQDANSLWSPLAGKVTRRSLSAKESFAEHTAIIKQLLSLSEELIDHFGISLDPDNDSYHLIAASLMQSPILMETLGRLRARGSTILASKTATTEERAQVMSLVNKANEYYDSIGRELEKSFSTNPALSGKLAGLNQAARENGEQVLKLAHEQISTPEQFSYPATDFFAKVTDSINAQMKLYDATVDELEKLLQARASQLVATKYLLMAALLGLSLVGAGIAYLIVRSITEPLDEAVAHAKRVAAGDLTGHIMTNSNNETGQLLQALKAMNESLVRIVTEVRGGTETILAASSQIAAGNTDLSSRTEQQAGSLQETAASMEEITSTVKQNAENAMQANQLSLSASEVASKGGVMVSQVVETMGSINESSRKIVDIISVIDGIAFQTNILALNAAVEAARAGEQGRGFAVVAAEVRNLAQRSAAAAKEVKELIGASVEKVDAGAKLVNETGATMNEIVNSIKHVSDIIGEITAASREQRNGIELVNEAITQMDQATQQNASLVEEAAAAAESLRDQAQSLSTVVSVFKLNPSYAVETAAIPALKGTTAVALGSRQRKVTAK